MNYLLILFLFCAAQTQAGTPSYAGFRASRILNSYPNRVFPTPQYWSSTAKQIAQKFPGSQPAGIWIVSLYIDNGITQCNFPSGGISLPNVNFISTDQNETYLKHFDTTGIKVWLQIEPGNAEIDTLISIVLNRYKHHPSVIGFGIDVEWYRNNAKVPDSLAQRWDEKVRAIDSSYTLFLKHYAQSWMPPKYRGKILFVDDSQNFNFAQNPFNAMVSEFKSWAGKFSPNASAFQFGYTADSVWWKNFSDPMKTIGDALSANISTLSALFWVDFTIIKVFPPTAVRRENTVPVIFSLEQNFPNPFNPATTIQYSLSRNSRSDGSEKRIPVTLTVYNSLGQKAAELVNEMQEEGTYSVSFNASSLPSGMYFYRLEAGRNSETKKLLFIK